jgi:hypothetical protein
MRRSWPTSGFGAMVKKIKGYNIHDHVMGINEMEFYFHVLDYVTLMMAVSNLKLKYALDGRE